MPIKYEVDKNNLRFEDFLLNIKNSFKENSHTIHKARNELKVITFNNVSTVVKAFKVPNILNQVVYAYFRNSKAKKSFLNAQKLKELNINTPEPIGYIEFYNNFLFKESFFIAKEYKYDFTIRDPLRNLNSKNAKLILQQFVHFTYDLHKNGVYHKDYSAGNILVLQKDENTYEFSIVDINRMEFKKVDLLLGLDNFAKLWLDEETIELIANEYAKVANQDENHCLEILKKADKKLKDFVLFKRRIRGKN